MIHLDENLMGPMCKATGALALASVLALAGCGGGGAQSNAAPPTLSLMLFAADDGATGIELWKTDGSATGTSLVKDINPGAGNSFPGGSGLFPSEFVFFNGAWFFSADDGTGPELWKSDGTQSGTTVRETAAGSSPREFTVLGHALYFSADEGLIGRELWKTDGTGAGTLRAGAVSLVSGLTAFNNVLYFSPSYGIPGIDLWYTTARA